MFNVFVESRKIKLANEEILQLVVVIIALTDFLVAEN